jgi:hypothetical protein
MAHGHVESTHFVPASLSLCISRNEVSENFVLRTSRRVRVVGEVRKLNSTWVSGYEKLNPMKISSG